MGEDSLDGSAESLGVEGGKFADEDHIDQVLRSGTAVAIAVASGIGVELLSEVLLERGCRDPGPGDLSEVEQVRDIEFVEIVWETIDETKVDGELFKEAPCDQRVGAEAHSSSEAFVDLADLLDLKLEVVVEVEGCCVDHCFGRDFKRGHPIEVDVAGRARVICEA